MQRNWIFFSSSFDHRVSAGTEVPAMLRTQEESRAFFAASHDCKPSQPQAVFQINKGCMLIQAAQPSHLCTACMCAIGHIPGPTVPPQREHRAGAATCVRSLAFSARSMSSHSPASHGCCGSRHQPRAAAGVMPESSMLIAASRLCERRLALPAASSCAGIKQSREPALLQRRLPCLTSNVLRPPQICRRHQQDGSTRHE